MHTSYTTNPNFYPTTPDLIQQMIAPYQAAIRKQTNRWQIIDPNAGSGAILDYLVENLKVHKNQLYAIEQDPELIYTLQGKEYKVIHTDFLTYQGDYLFDLILMNPPFDKADEHLLKAWDTLQSGHITCLLNEQTLKNPYSQKRKLLLDIIKQHGQIEYLGSAFSHAQRNTSVKVALIRLEKSQLNAKFSFAFAGKEKQVEFTQEALSSDLCRNDLTGAMLRQYEEVKTAFLQFYRAKKALDFYAKGIVSTYYKVVDHANLQDSAYIQEAYNGFISDFKAEVWRTIISKLGMNKLMTKGVVDDLNKYIKAQGAMDLTRENIGDLFDMLIENRVQIMERAIVDVFDVLCRYHEHNKWYVEGWKTNKAWKVNRKIILPNGCRYGTYMNARSLKDFGDNFHVNSDTCYDDIDKVMCYLTGFNYDQCLTVSMALDNHFSRLGRIKTGDTFVNRLESAYFFITFWRKGTIHLEFKDSKLWEEFNYRACLGKNFLPQEEIRRKRPQHSATPPQTEQLILFA